MKKILIIGGGPAGMIAAIFAARNGHNVHLYEKNEKLGKKLYITGKGRCNITNACDMEELMQNVITNNKFLYSAFYSFNNFDVIDFFESIGLRTKIERGNRVFPESDKSSDVISALTREMNKLNVNIHFKSEVKDIIIENESFKSIKLSDGRIVEGDSIIIATGGLSYKATGSTGDGYRFAEDMGHTVTPTMPSIVPMNIKESWIKELQGLSLRNISIKITSKGREVYSDFGELLFTHFGVSGPVILSASRFIIPYLKNKDLILTIDLKPALTDEQLDTRILRDFEMFKNRQFVNALDELLPKKLIPIVINLSGISPDKRVNEITKEERTQLITCIKQLPLSIIGLRDYNEAVITYGGISIKEVNPSTMESKKIQNVYFVGEVLDLDALTGGYNLQIAWSTGYIAGISV